MTNTMTATSYPSRAQITTRIAEDDVFMLECLQVMYCRQTQHEQDTKSTLNRNRAGFITISHAFDGSTLAVKARQEVLSEDELSKARSIVCRYGKQLASHFRQVAITESALKAVATLFSAG